MIARVDCNECPLVSSLLLTFLFAAIQSNISDPPQKASLEKFAEKVASYNQHGSEGGKDNKHCVGNYSKVDGPYCPLQSAHLYNEPHSGTATDWYFGELGVAALSIEIGNRFFQDCDFFENDMLEDNIASLMHAVKTARDPFVAVSLPSLFFVHTISSLFLHWTKKNSCS